MTLIFNYHKDDNDDNDIGSGDDGDDDADDDEDDDNKWRTCRSALCTSVSAA